MKRNLGVRYLALILTLLALAGSAAAQKGLTTVQDLRLGSKVMARDMPYRVVLPVDYEKAASERYAVVYLLHGLTGHFDNWVDKTKLKEYAAGYRFIIVTPEGGDGWYSDSVSVANDKYESYIIQELIPEIDKKFRTLADREHRVIAGLSMGGYGSLKFGLKYPDKFTIAGSFSGALSAAEYTEKKIGNLGKTIDAVFGPENGESRISNDIFKIIGGLAPEKQKALPFLYVDCGTEDFLFQSNTDFLDLLRKHKVPHQYRELPGAHNWAYWDSQVKEFLEMVQTRVK